jgi:hypothetical protein
VATPDARAASILKADFLSMMRMKSSGIKVF